MLLQDNQSAKRVTIIKFDMFKTFPIPQLLTYAKSLGAFFHSLFGKALK